MFAVGAQEIGNGTRLSAVTQEFAQGGVDFTDRALDLAMSGEGFFTVSDNGVVAYTRVGSFGVDRDGFVVNNQNQRLQIFPPTNTGGFNTGTLEDLRLATADSPPQADFDGVVRHQPAGQRVAAAGRRVRPEQRVDLQPFDGHLHFRLARRVARRDGVLRQDGDRRINGNARFYIDGTAVGGANAMTYSNVGVLTTPATGTFTLPAYTPASGAAPITPRDRFHPARRSTARRSA